VVYIYGVHDVRQVNMHTDEPLVPETSLVEVKIALGNSERYKSLGPDQIPAEFFQSLR
jgi:hypothetical protein